jgi:hypothetical protein
MIGDGFKGKLFSCVAAGLAFGVLTQDDSPGRVEFPDPKADAALRPAHQPGHRAR